VTTPDEVRERVSTADASWQTLEIEGRTWQDRIAAREAAVAVRRERGLASTVRTVPSGSALPQGQREQAWHLWRGGEVLVRCEYEIGRELVTVVGQGPRWWRWSPTLGPTSGGGVGRPVRLMLGPPAIFLSFHTILEQLEFPRVRDTTVSGRRAFTFRATANATRPRGRAALREVGPGASEYEVSVDAERGVLLGLTALRDGNAFLRVETTRVAFDAPLAPNLFTPDSSEPARGAPLRASQHVSVDDIAESVPFTLLAPQPSPSPISPHVAVFDGDRRGLGPRRVVFVYVVVDPSGGRGQLRITEAGTPLLSSIHDNWISNGEIEVCEQLHGRVQRRRIRAQRNGVHVELESAVLPVPRLVEVLKSMAPMGSPR
jgi:hypothetical protein